MNLASALARREIQATGPVIKVLRLVPAVEPLYQQYPALLKAKGLVNDWEQSVRIYALLGMEEKVRTTMGMLEEAAKRSNRHISLTRALVDHWLKGDMTDSLCD